MSDHEPGQLELRLHQGLLETVFQNVEIGVGLMRGSDLRFVMVNPAYQAIAPCREILGKTIFDAWPEALPELEKRCRSVLDTGVPYKGVDEVYSLIDAAGQPGTRYFTWSMHRVQLPGNEGVGILVTVRETTLRKQTEQALSASKERFRTAIGAVSSLIWTNSPEGEMIGEQPGWAYFTGQTRDEYQGYGWSKAVHPDDAQPTIDAWHRAVAERKTFDFEHRLLRKDGVWRLCSIRAVPVFESNGDIREWVGVHTDITEQRETLRVMEQTQRDLQEALKETELARQQADSARKAKDHFLAILSHELRTPLTPVLMAVETMAMEKNISADMQESLEVIRRNIGLEVRFINDLLDVTRIESGKLELDFEECDLHSVVMRAVEVCQQEIDAKHQHLEIQLGATTPKLRGDVRRLQQIFWNLLKNASKFTPEHGAIRLQSRREAGWLVVSVSDNGVGFGPEMEQRLFQPFSQGDGMTKQFGGLGLGLAIAKGTVDGHHGKLLAESKGPGKGATFTVYLPVLETSVE